MAATEPMEASSTRQKRSKAVRRVIVLGLAAVTSITLGLGSGGPAQARTQQPAEPSPGVSGMRLAGDADGAGYRMRLAGRFAPPRAFVVPHALTYDQRYVPAGAGVEVRQRVRGGRMAVAVAVRGLAANRTFGAHVHTKPCGELPDDSGPHYQHVKDPVQPSTDPRYANARNEVWLDFTTDGKGNGAASSRQSWTFREGEARSVVLHEHGTHTGQGQAGQAGDRLACFSVPLDAASAFGAAGKAAGPAGAAAGGALGAAGRMLGALG